MTLNSWCARTQQPACVIITGSNSQPRNLYISLGLMQFYRTAEQLWWNHVCARRSKWTRGTAKRRWGGEEALSSTFHKIRPLEIRWCQNLCICYALKKSVKVQERSLPWQADMLIETFVCPHNTAKWRAAVTVEILWHWLSQNRHFRNISHGKRVDVTVGQGDTWHREADRCSTAQWEWHHRRSLDN